MKTYIIDTNALLSFVTDRNAEQQARVAELFELATRLKCRILCHQHVITEFVYVLDKVYHYAKPSINQMIRDFINMPGIEIIHEVNFKILLKYWPNIVSDFGDSVIASLWKMNKKAFVVTFDKRFKSELQKIGARLYETK